jgi:membrane-bound metal-dependent hydrolase YbcI (DUF457 family)
LPFAFGYFIHILLDGITIQGIMPFYPYKIKMRGIIRTGSIIEDILFFFALTADLYLATKILGIF